MICVAKSKLRPLGKILHILGGEAITRPQNTFKGKNSRVTLANSTDIGKLGDPFGPASRPYQPISLKKDLELDLVGVEAFALVRKKQRRRRSKNPSNKK